MKKFFFPILLLIFIIITFLSCSNTSSKRSRRPLNNIKISPEKNVVFGDNITLDIKTKLANGEINKINIYLNNNLLTSTKDLNFEYVIENIASLGNNTIKVEAIKTDGVKNSKLKKFSVFSDIIPKQYTYKIVNEYPHSRDFFTEGLVVHNGYIYEGTGDHGTSGIYKTDIKTGKVLQSVELEEQYFGEGITILNDKIYQLTYRSQTGFVYDVNDFSVIDTFNFESTQGWGLTNDGTHLIMDDRTNFLTWLDPNDFSVVKKVAVADNTQNMNAINELEYIDGKIWANVWTTDYVVIIDPVTGRVESMINFSGILKDKDKLPSKPVDVFNGIAYDEATGKIYVTGKFYPKLYEIELVELK